MQSILDRVWASDQSTHIAEGHVTQWASGERGRKRLREFTTTPTPPAPRKPSAPPHNPRIQHEAQWQPDKRAFRIACGRAAKVRATRSGATLSVTIDFAIPSQASIPVNPALQYRGELVWGQDPPAPPRPVSSSRPTVPDQYTVKAVQPPWTGANGGHW